MLARSNLEQLWVQRCVQNSLPIFSCMLVGVLLTAEVTGSWQMLFSCGLKGWWELTLCGCKWRCEWRCAAEDSSTRVVPLKQHADDPMYLCCFRCARSIFEGGDGWGVIGQSSHHSLPSTLPGCLALPTAALCSPTAPGSTGPCLPWRGPTYTPKDLGHLRAST